MSNQEFTTSDGEQVFNDGSYKQLPDDLLQKATLACLNATGPNISAVDRIRKKGEMMAAELTARQKKRLEQETATTLTFADTTVVAQESVFNESSWTAEKLQKIISNGIEESLQMEFKSAASLSRESRKMTEITKDVSSMANSAGGTIIYGISQHKEAGKEHLPEKLDVVSRVDFPKEWLEHVVSQIKPRIQNLHIHAVSMDACDAVVYVVEIPQGATAHQANDYRYYKRYNFESVPMVDHEIRDVMNRKSSVRLALNAKLVTYNSLTKDGNAGALIVTLSNLTEVFARYVGFVIEAPLMLNGALICYDDATLENITEYAWRLSFSNHDDTPLFPGGTLSRLFYFKRAPFKDLPPKPELSYFRWVAYADSMAKQSGRFNVEDILEQHP